MAALHLGVGETSIRRALRREKEAAPIPDPVKLLETDRLRAQAKEARRNADQLLEALKAAKSDLETLTELASAPLPPIQRRELGSGLREAAAIALLSDLHVETLVRPDDTPFGNCFTLGIADLRLCRFFDSVIWQVEHAKSAFQIRDLVLWVGGDLITNHLHPENVETAQLGPTAALVWVQERIVGGIRKLLASGHFERIDLVCSWGNHGRTSKEIRNTTGADHSFEWLLYQNLAAIFANDDRVRVFADRAAHQYHKVYDFELHFHHGHQIKYGGGVGGIMIPTNKAVAAWDRVSRCDFHFFGHYHQYLDVGNVTGNGSLIGYDSYAMSVKAIPEPPQQAFCLIDSKRGKAMAAPLWVGDPSSERKIWKKVKGIYQ